MKHGSLCTGYGGLDLAVDAVLGSELVWLSEIEAAPSTVCDVRFSGVPNLGDLTVLDWSQVEPIDVLTAGYPCQPFSHAGKREGTSDERHLWPYIAECVRVLRPRLAVFENVAGHLSLGFDAVLSDLAAVGFDVEWVVVRASDVGACHRRARLFIVASDPFGEPLRDGGRGRLPRAEGAPEGDGSERQRVRPGVVDGSEDAPDAECAERRSPNERRGCVGEGEHAAGQAAGRSGECGTRPTAPDADGGRLEQRDEGERGVPLADSDGSYLADADDLGCEGSFPAWRHDERGDQGPLWGDYGPAIERHARVLGRPAPAPVDDEGRLSARFVEWMMMLPAGWVTDVLPSRTKALKCLGNGVVPAQAMYALRGLLDRYGLDAVGFGESVADEYRRPRVGIDTFGDVGVVEGNGQGDLCHVDDSDARVPEVKRVG